MIEMLDKVMDNEEMLKYGVLVDKLYTGGDELYSQKFFEKILREHDALYFLYIVDDYYLGTRARFIKFNSLVNRLSFVLRNRDCGHDLIDVLCLQIMN